MAKRLLLILAAPLLVVPLLPAESHADASVVQDSCIAFWEGGKEYSRIWFSVINFGLPVPICDLHFIPEPQPPDPGCVMVECSSPDGWTCFTNPLGGADWFANTPADCIDPGGPAKRQFDFVLDPEYCCYIVQFTDPTGTPVLEQEECFFPCPSVAAEGNPWGEVKSLYR